MMKLPQFLKEVIYAFHPLKYKQFSQKPVYKSLIFTTKVLLIAFLLAGILFLPKIFLLKSTIENELTKFGDLRFSAKVEQNSEFTVPKNNPWVRVDMNNNLTLKDELFVIDKDTVQYRFLSPVKLERNQLKEASLYRPEASKFISTLIILLIPGVALLLFIRLWLKYFLLILAVGTLFFLITDLTRYKMKWRNMISSASHAITPVILLEVASSAITTMYLFPIPNFRFLGLKMYGVTLIIFAIMMIFAVLACRIEDYREKRK